MRLLVDSRNAADLVRFLDGRAFAAEESGALAHLTQLSGKRATLESARGINQRGLHRSAGPPRFVVATIESLELQDNFEIDLGDVAKLDYYTGLTFNIYVKGAATRIGSGALRRADSRFGKAEPAVGFVLDLDALTTVLLARAQDPNLSQEQQRNESPITNSDPSVLFREARTKRSDGERVLINFER
jgi:ATP phosphoribosyltransferase regulatory subunit